MSKPLQYDSLLVRELAVALQRRFGGRAIRWIRIQPGTRSIQLHFGRQTLDWDLAAAGGSLRVRAGRGRGGQALPRGSRVARVSAPADDRVVEWRIEASGGDEPVRLRLFVELMPNRRNAVLVAAHGRVLASLAGPPEGATYEPPPSRPRAGAEQPLDGGRFETVLREAAGAGRVSRVLSQIAYTSPLNAAAILGAAATSDEADAMALAWSRYRAIVEPGAGPPGVIDPGGLDQPYPTRLPGQPFAVAPDLLAAFAAVAPAEAAVAEDGAAVLQALVRSRRSLARRIERLEAERQGAEAEQAGLRRRADLLMSQLDRARRGMSEVILDDWAGGSTVVELDPALDPAANARDWYDRARKRGRAARRIPGLIAAARTEMAELARLERRVREGHATDAELARFAPGSALAGRPATALPYRRYTTSGGLEVRVGRSARANDALTLHHSDREDIWLHARDAAGAHVILRWNHREANPPSPDLAEAAVLAALHSRARTSGTVAVDWTRRKYVRKPRKAGPGLVRVERARTIFVAPDPAVEARLRSG